MSERKPGWYRVRPKKSAWRLTSWQVSTLGWAVEGCEFYVPDSYWAEIDERPVPVDRHPWDVVREVVERMEDLHWTTPPEIMRRLEGA